MTPAIEQCTNEVVKLLTSTGPISVAAYRWQDFAVHLANGDDRWLISHLPSGMAIDIWSFKKKEPACEAMLEISRLRNRWVDIPATDVEKLTAQVSAICEKHGARKGKKHEQIEPPTKLNGYEEATFDGKVAE